MSLDNITDMRIIEVLTLIMAELEELGQTSHSESLACIIEVIKQRLAQRLSER